MAFIASFTGTVFARSAAEGYNTITVGDWEYVYYDGSVTKEVM